MTHAVVLIEAERDGASPTLGGQLADVEGVAEAYSRHRRVGLRRDPAGAQPGGGRAGRDRTASPRSRASSARRRWSRSRSSPSTTSRRCSASATERCVRRPANHRPTSCQRAPSHRCPSRRASGARRARPAARRSRRGGTRWPRIQRAADGAADRAASAPIAFNLRVTRHECSVVAGDGRVAAPRAQGPGLDSSSSRCELPAYKGDVGGILPIVAAASWTRSSSASRSSSRSRRARRASTTRAGYSLVFRVEPQAAHVRPARAAARSRCPGARDGVKLLLLATPAGGAGKARDVGTSGLLEDARTAASASGRRAVTMRSTSTSSSPSTCASAGSSRSRTSRRRASRPGS